MSYTEYRNRHDRVEHHFGTLEATLVELSEALGLDLPTGMTVEAAISVINDRVTRLENHDVHVFSLKADAVMRPIPTFTADAYVTAGPYLVEDKDHVNILAPPPLGSPINSAGDLSTFGSAVDDPIIFTTASSGGEASVGWVVMMVTETARMIISTLGSAETDTILYVFGPMDHAPTSTDDPWHYGDDNFSSGYLSQLLDTAPNAADGTDYLTGDAYAESDVPPYGLTVPPGLYYFAITPYSAPAASGSTYINFTRIVEQSGSLTADAWTLVSQPGSFTADAVVLAVVGSSVTADAVTKDTVTIATTTADAWLVATITDSFTADAWLAGGPVTDSITAHAVLLALMDGSITADAYITDGSAPEPSTAVSLGAVTLGEFSLGGSVWAAGALGSITADSVIKANISGSVDADAVVKSTQSGSFTADAFVAGTFTANAVLQATQNGSFTADAYISDGSEQPASSTMGEINLGEGTLGG